MTQNNHRALFTKIPFESLKLTVEIKFFIVIGKFYRVFFQTFVLTCNSSISLEYFFDVRFGNLKCVQIPNEDSRIDGLRVLGTRLVPNFAQTHDGESGFHLAILSV